jgi:cell division protein FtsN
MYKKTLFFLVIASLAAGCDFVSKINPFAEKVDTLEIYRQRQDSIRRAVLLERQQEEFRRERAAAERADSVRKVTEVAELQRTAHRYHLVVASFKTPSYASVLSEQIRSQGYDSRIMISKNQFHRVTLKSFDNFQTAIREMNALRSSGEYGDAWVHIGN